MRLVWNDRGKYGMELGWFWYLRHKPFGSRCLYMPKVFIGLRVLYR